MSSSAPSPLRIWFAAARPRTLPAAVAPVLVGSALAWRDGGFIWTAALACLAFALLIQIGTNFANDYYDFVQGADTAERVGPRRAVASGWVTPAMMRAAMFSVFAVAFLVGLTLLKFGGWPMLAVGVSSIVCGIAYTGGPYPLGYNGLGDLFVFIFFGLVAVTVTYFVQAQAVTVEAFTLAAGVGLLAANILVVNNYRDVETDTVAGKRTLVVRWGRPAARAQFIAAHVLALLAVVVTAYRHAAPWTLLPLMLTPLAWRQARELARAESAEELILLLGETGQYLALYALLLSIGLVL